MCSKSKRILELDVDLVGYLLRNFPFFLCFVSLSFLSLNCIRTGCHIFSLPLCWRGRELVYKYLFMPCGALLGRCEPVFEDVRNSASPYCLWRLGVRTTWEIQTSKPAHQLSTSNSAFASWLAVACQHSSFLYCLTFLSCQFIRYT